MTHSDHEDFLQIMYEKYSYFYEMWRKQEETDERLYWWDLYVEHRKAYEEFAKGQE